LESKDKGDVLGTFVKGPPLHHNVPVVEMLLCSDHFNKVGPLRCVNDDERDEPTVTDPDGSDGGVTYDRHHLRLLGAVHGYASISAQLKFHPDTPAQG
jgi:hypothetical protein